MFNTTSLPSSEILLTSGGDARLALQAESGKNHYGCRPYPEADLLAFGSATASPLAEHTFFAVEQLRSRIAHSLQRDDARSVYLDEQHRIRNELIELCGLKNLHGLEVLLTTSGTDAHRLAAQLLANQANSPLAVLMVATNETGSGVSAALSASGASCREIPLRELDGSPRSSAEIDADFEREVVAAAARGQSSLLTLVDSSKTGLIAPSVACALALQRRFPHSLTVLVDACQFRLAPATVHAYLAHGFMLALTGSKFIGAPSFSGALLFPENLAKMLSNQIVKYHSAAPVNFGLLLRWEGALKELRHLNALSNSVMINFIHEFSAALYRASADYPALEWLSVPPLQRVPLADAGQWDNLPTVFPFLLFHLHPDGRKTPFSREQSRQIYLALQADTASPRVQLAQPVACGQRAGVEISALRLCLSARLIVAGCAEHGQRQVKIITEALVALQCILQQVKNITN